MKARVVGGFFDVKEKVPRSVGDEFELTEKRFNEINSAGFGELVVKVAEEATAPKPRTASKPRAKKG